METASDLELQGRYQEVFQQYLTLAPKVAQALEEFGRVRTEVLSLLKEMQERGLSTETEQPEPSE